jgi:hypothetical protein
VQGEKMQKEMNIDAVSVAIAYEPKPDLSTAFRRRSASMQSNTTVDTTESDVDPEILMNDLEVSDSPAISLRKKIAT